MTILQDNRLTLSDVGMFYYIKHNPNISEHNLTVHFQHCSLYSIRQVLSRLYNLGYLSYYKQNNDVFLDIKNNSSSNSVIHSSRRHDYNYQQFNDKHSITTLYSYYITQFQYNRISNAQRIKIRQAIKSWLNHYSISFIKDEIHKITNNQQRVQNIKYPLAYLKVSLYSDSHQNNQNESYIHPRYNSINESDGFTIRRATPKSKVGRFFMGIIDKHLNNSLK